MSILVCCTGADFHKKIICKSVLTIKITDLGLSGETNSKKSVRSSKKCPKRERCTYTNTMYICKYRHCLQCNLLG